MKTEEILKKQITDTNGDICRNYTKEDILQAMEDYAQQAIASHEADTKRLDKLQSLTKGYGKGWVLRDSSNGRGMRLHETSLDNAVSDVRTAIDLFELPKPYQPC